MQHYSMLIQWNGEAFIVTFPDFPGHSTQGSSWTEAAKNGEVLLGQILESGELPRTTDTQMNELKEIRKELEEELRRAEDQGRELKGW